MVNKIDKILLIVVGRKVLGGGCERAVSRISLLRQPEQRTEVAAIPVSEGVDHPLFLLAARERGLLNNSLPFPGEISFFQ